MHRFRVNVLEVIRDISKIISILYFTLVKREKSYI